MTLEERVEFLHQSIESHDHQIGELTDGIAELKAGAVELKAGIADLRAGIKEGFDLTQVNFNRLATAMLGLSEHVSTHAGRLDALEQL